MEQRTTDSASRIFGVFLVDFVIGISLILMACIVGELLHDNLAPDVSLLYLPCFLVALMPFMLYLRWRERMNVDWWDFLAYGSAVSFFAFTFDTLPALPHNLDTILEAFLFALVFTFVMHHWERYRSTTFPRQREPEES